MNVYKLTISQKDSLIGKTFDGIQYFNPIQDNNDDWIISTIEVDQCTHDTGIEFIHSLPLIEFVPKPYPLD